MKNAFSRALLTFAIGAVGGGVFAVLNLPLPWLLGALLATVIASLSGAPVEIKPGLRKYLVVVLGVMLGGTFTPDILDNAAAWVPTLIAAVAYLSVLTVIAQFYCRKVLKMDKVTAIFSGMPGGLSEMVILGEDHGADVRMLTLTHAVRVAAILVMIPLFLTTWSDAHASAPVQVRDIWSSRDAAILVAAALAGVGSGRILRLPAHHLTGPLMVSVAVHLSGLVITARPPEVSLIVQVAMGSALGARFCGVSVRELGRQLILILGMALTMMAVTLFSASLLSQMTEFSFAALVLALSPGGFAEMALVALSMDIDPAFVTTHHGARLAVVVFIAPVVLSVWIKRSMNGSTSPD